MAKVTHPTMAVAARARRLRGVSWCLAMALLPCATHGALATTITAVATPATATTTAPLAPSSAIDPADPRAVLALKFGASPANVRATGLPGIYEVTESTEVLYVSADGKYMLVGDLFDLATKANLTEARRKDIRRGLLAGVKDDEVITFAPAAPKYELYVFTDVDCGFCRRLHAQMPELNGMGIRVRYLFFPRTGMGTDSARKAESVWCAANRQAALTQAKTGAEVVTRRCKNPVEAGYKLGQAMGLQGTPALYTPAGDEIRNGEPQDILRQLVEAGR